ncbi:hypothetical protein TW73_19325 [Pseudoalteromonas piscicida]|nr:hypothetical protein [Pseudoalteromonas piscicida]KJY93542.1 hypothetical protein TW73_19325 [Pseudoalteromonas piscicida]
MAKKEIKGLLDQIRCLFPELGPLMDKHEPWATTYQMEAFADLTTLAFNHKKQECSKAYLGFISNQLVDASPAIREFIDVYYVEHLFWCATQQGIDFGWPLIPTNLKALYLDFHGSEPTPIS